MATPEENFYRVGHIILDVIPKDLRRLFKSLWDSKYPNTPWDDRPASGQAFLQKERNQSVKKTVSQDMLHGNSNRFDGTCLFSILLYSSQKFFQGRPNAKPHIDSLRIVRNGCFAHLPSASITDHDYQILLTNVKTAFQNLGWPTNPICDIEQKQLNTSQLKTLENSLIAEKKRNQSLENRLSLVEENSKASGQKLQTMQTKITTTEENVKTVTDLARTNRKNIDSFRSDMASAGADINDAKIKLESMQAELTSAKKLSEANTERIHSMQSNMTSSNTDPNSSESDRITKPVGNETTQIIFSMVEFGHTRSAENVLMDVYEKVVSLVEDKTIRAEAIVKNFVIGTLMEQMRRMDSLFGLLYKDVFYADTFCDEIDFHKATNFSLNVVLELPFYLSDLNICGIHSPDAQTYDVESGYVVLYSEKPFDALLRPGHPKYSDYTELGKFFEGRSTGRIFGKRYYVIHPSLVLNWYEKVVVRALNQLIYGETFDIGFDFSFCLPGSDDFEKYSREKFYIFRHNLYQYLNQLTTPFESTDMFHPLPLLNESFLGSGIENEDQNVVIKILKSNKSEPTFTLVIASSSGLVVNVDLVPTFQFKETFLVPKLYYQKRHLWRLSYPLREQEIIYNHNFAEKIIKLLKRFRDMQGDSWMKLSSYCLKTLVMSELKDSHYERNLGDLFIQVLHRLRDCLAERKIPFYFDDRCNLLAGVSDKTIKNMKGRLEKILSDIEKNPPITLRKYFDIRDCDTRTIDGQRPSWCTLM